MNRFKKLIAFLTFSVTVAAFLSVDVSASTDYTLVEGDIHMTIAETYTLSQVINNPCASIDGVGFSSPQDMFLNEQGYLFVVDTGNNRVVKLTMDGTLVAVFTGPANSPLKKPQGIWVDDEGNMYIADTGNYRILHLSADGSYVEQFACPDSELLGDDFIFDPTKVAVSPTGQIYALKGQYLMCIDAYNNFRGYVGQTKIAYNLGEVLTRMFGSEKSKAAIVTRVAASYTNLFMDDSGLIYATTEDTRNGELKKLNAVGTNTLKDYGALGFLGTMYDKTIQYHFDDLAFHYGDYTMYTGSEPDFSDLTVDDYGVITAIDNETKKVFQYDSESNLLCAFGAYGEGDGYFENPVSIVQDTEGNLYILDSLKNNIQIFSPTAFIQTVHEAVHQYDLGDYDAAAELWEEAMGICENYSNANVGLALAAYHKENWTESMAQYKLAGDRTGYSKAFSKYRQSILRSYFLPVAGVSLLIIAVFMAIVMIMKKSAAKAMRHHLLDEPNRYATSNMLLCAAGVGFHPFDTLSVLKNSRARIKNWIGIIILAAVFATRVFSIYAVHYPLVSLNPRDANLLIEFVKLILPILTASLSCYLVISIVGGESKLNEIFTAFSISWVPYIFINFTLTLLSHVLCREEEGLFVFLATVSTLIPILLMILSINLLNNYSFGKTLGVAVLSVLVMVLLWIVVLMISALSVQLYEFVIGIFQEYKMLSL